jgi:hypothetical protein
MVQPYQQQHQGGQQQYPGQMAHAGGGQPALIGLQMKRRNPFGVWLGLPFITLGIYGIVWFCLVHSELSKFDRRRGASAGMAFCSLLFGWLTLGIWPLVMWVKLGGHINAAQRSAGLQPSCSGGLGFLLGIFGFGTLYYQIELNKVADRYGAPAGTQVPLAV